MREFFDKSDKRGERDRRLVSHDPVAPDVASPHVSLAPLAPRVAWLVALLLAPIALAETIDVTVRRAPYTVGGASTKSEHAWAPCKYCGSKTGYARTYRWNYDRHVWVETTNRETVPDVCRKCRQKEKGQEKLDRQERKLNAEIEYQRTRLRIKEKKRELEALRKEAR